MHNKLRERVREVINAFDICYTRSGTRGRDPDDTYRDFAHELNKTLWQLGILYDSCSFHFYRQAFAMADYYRERALEAGCCYYNHGYRELRNAEAELNAIADAIDATKAEFDKLDFVHEYDNARRVREGTLQDFKDVNDKIKQWHATHGVKVR